MDYTKDGGRRHRDIMIKGLKAEYSPASVAAVVLDALPEGASWSKEKVGG